MVSGRLVRTRCASPSASNNGTSTAAGRRQGGSVNWNFGTVFESVADAIPDHTALVQGERRRTWREFDERASRLAGAFRALGLGPDSKVAFYLYNSNEYLETLFATFK